MPSHYLNQCWLTINWTLGDKLQWNCNWNSNTFIEDRFKNVVSYHKWNSIFMLDMYMEWRCITSLSLWFVLTAGRYYEGQGRVTSPGPRVLGTGQKMAKSSSECYKAWSRISNDCEKGSRCISIKHESKVQVFHRPVCWWSKCFIRDRCHCPACRTTLVATRFRVAVICPIIQVPHCIRVFFYFVWFVFINHIFQFYYELCTYCNILDIYLS